MRSCVLALAFAAACEAASLGVKVTPALGGHFRPGLPVLLRVTLANEGKAAEGTLDVVVEGITYRQPVRVGARATATVDVLAAVHLASCRVRVRARSESGELLCDGVADVALVRREPSERLVVVVGGAGSLADSLFEGKVATVAVSADALPTLAAAYWAADAVLLRGDGGELAVGARAALAGWVRGGGVVIFVLDAGAPVRDEGLVVELAAGAGRPTATEWLRVLAEEQRTRAVGQGVAWDVGLGTVVAGTADGFAGGVLEPLVPKGPQGDIGVDGGLYEVFQEPRLGSWTRWRLVGGTVGLLLAGTLVVLLLRGRGGRTRLVGVLFALAALAVVAWGLMLPSGRGVVEVVAVDEGGAGRGGLALRAEVVSVGAVGRGRVELSFGRAEAVVPIYYAADDVGAWRDVVLSRDGAGEWSLRCDVRRGVRRCFAVWWLSEVGGTTRATSGVLSMRRGPAVVWHARSVE